MTDITCMYNACVCLNVCADHREKLVLYFVMGLLIGGISVLLLVNIYLMVILVRHRRQLRGLGARPVSSRLRRGRRGREPPPTSPAEAVSFVDSGRGSVHPPPSASPEVSRRGVQRPRPSRRPPSPFEVVQPTTPTSPPGQVHLPPRDSPVFVHVESPRESPLLGRVPPVPGAAGDDELLPPSVDVASPPSDSTAREESPIWVRLYEPPESDGTLTVPTEAPRVSESPVWVHFAFDDSPSTTVSTSTAAAVPVAVPSSTSVSPASTLAAPGRAAVVSPGEPQPVRPARAQPQSAPPNGEKATLTRSFSNPYRQDTYRTAERRAAVTPQRPRQRRLLRFD